MRIAKVEAEATHLIRQESLASFARGALYGPGNAIVLHIQKNNAAIMPQQFHAASAVFSPEMNPMPWW